MKKILFIIAVLLSFGVHAQTFTPIHNYQAPDGLDVVKFFGIPYGANPTLNGVNRPNAHPLYYKTTDSSLYLYTGSQWIIVGGGSSAAKDTVDVGYGLGVTWENDRQKIFAIHPDGYEGGIVTYSGTGFDFNVSPITLYLRNEVFLFPETTLTLSPPNSQPRYDIFGVDSLGAFVKSGDTSALPIEPQIGVDSFALTKAFLISPGDTAPSNITTVIIYDQNTEWTTGTQGSTSVVDFDNTDNPLHLTKDIFISKYNNNSRLYFVNGSYVSTENTPQSVLLLPIYLNSALAANNNIYIRLYDTLTASTNLYRLGSNDNFNKNEVNAYQTVVIPTSNLTWINNKSTFTSLLVTFTGYDTSGANGLYMDYIRLQKGLSQTGNGSCPLCIVDIHVTEDSLNQVGIRQNGDTAFMFNWTGSGSGGGIQSVVAGTNVTVDNTDPLNPVVSATGSGGVSQSVISDTLKNYANSGSITTDNVVYSTPIALSVANHLLTGSFALKSQSAYTLFGRGSGSGSPSFLTSIDSNWIPSLHSEAYYNTKYGSGGLSAINNRTYLGNTSGSSAVPDTLHYSVFNVKDFGLKNDSSTDNTTALRSLISQVPDGSTIYFPGGGLGYLFTDSIVINKNLIIKGDGNSGISVFVTTFTNIGKGATNLYFNSSTKNFLCYKKSASNINPIIRVRDLNIENVSTSTPTAGNGIIIRDEIGFSSHERITVNGFYNNVQVESGHNTTINHCNIVFPVKTGIILGSIIDPDYGDARITDNFIYSGKINTTDAIGILIKGAGGIIISRNFFNSSRTTTPASFFQYPIYGEFSQGSGTSEIKIADNIIDNYRVTGIYITTSTEVNNVMITGNQLATRDSASVLRSAISINNIGNSFVGSNYASVVAPSTSYPFLNITNCTNIVVGLNNYKGYPVLNNTVSGQEALYSNTTGGYNTVSGYIAMKLNTTGSYNTATGYASMYSNTTGSNNTATGRLSLFSNTSGTTNTATGYSSLYSNTIGTNNTANGNMALYYNTTGTGNTANGYSALDSNTTGSGNAANGYSALYSNKTGNNNTANGAYALYNNTTGGYNIADGYLAGSVVATDSVTTNTTSANSIFIGAFTRPATNGQTNQIVIGYGANGAGSNTVALGNPSITKVLTYGTVVSKGGIQLNYQAKTANYTVTNLDHTIECTSGTFTVTIPNATSGITGQEFLITNSGSGTITIATTASQTFVNVTGTPTTLSVPQFTSYKIISNGTNLLAFKMVN